MAVAPVLLVIMDGYGLAAPCAGNAAALLGCADIDGALVGGASLILVEASQPG